MAVRTGDGSGGYGFAQFMVREERIGHGQSVIFSETQEAMKIGAGDGQAARGERLVSVVLANGGDGKPDFVVAELTLEGAGRLVVGNVDDLVETGRILFRLVILEVQVFSANDAAWRQDDGALHDVFKLADVSGPGVALEHLHRRRLDGVHWFLEDVA